MKLSILIAGILISLVLYYIFDINENGVSGISSRPSASSSSNVNTLPNKDGGGEESKVGNNLRDILIARGPGKLLETLDELNAKGITGNSKNLDELDLRFRTSKDTEERVRLARLYNSAYFGTEDRFARERISKTISELLKTETVPSVGRALALSHSRLFFNEQTKENLNFAYKNKFLSNDDYYGELAHIILGTLASTRSEIVKEIATSHNRYASEIVADLVIHSEKLEFSKEEASSLRKYLTEIEPTFGGSPSSFGMIDAIRYEQWLRAIAIVESKENSSSADSLIFNKLTSANVDPRAAISLLISPYAETLLKEAKYLVNMNEIRQKAEKFIAQNPSELALQQAGAQIKNLFIGK